MPFFEVKEVFLACHQRKAGKNDSDRLLRSDAIINAPIAFHELL